jgi:hypothetical protein
MCVSCSRAQTNSPCPWFSQARQVIAVSTARRSAAITAPFPPVLGFFLGFFTMRPSPLWIGKPSCWLQTGSVDATAFFSTYPAGGLHFWTQVFTLELFPVGDNPLGT